MDGVGVHGRRRRPSRRPELYALFGTAAWWSAYAVFGSFVAALVYAALFVAGAIRLAVSVRRNGWPGAAARASRGLALATALSSVALLGCELAGGESRRMAEDLMDLGLVHFALIGPLFLLAAFLAWVGREHATTSRLWYVVYPGSWVVLLVLHRMS